MRFRVSGIQLPCGMWFGVALTLLVAASGLRAQPALAPDYPSIARAWLHDSIARQEDVKHLKLEVSVGAVDGRLKLAPCGNMEPYLPVGARAWGKTRVGLRCIDGMTRWNITMPATVKATGISWVVKGQIAAGSLIREVDLVESEVDWAEDSSPVLSDRAMWQGQTASRALTTGQTLRQAMVKPALVFSAGAPVRVVAQGAGFQVSADAQALSAGVVGQSARVRMDNGRITTGVVLDMRTVKIDL